MTEGVKEFGVKTGEVFIRNFDEGVVTTMGGFIDFPETYGPEMVKILGGNKRNYFMSVPQASELPIPVIFGNPDAVIEKQIYPSFLVMREAPVPAMGRWHSIGQKEYRIPAEGSQMEVVDGVSGYSAYEEKSQDMPYDINYQIHVYARLENQSIPMLRKVMRTYKPYCMVVLKDSLGETRTYTAFQESVNDIGELIDIADRMKGYSVGIRVEGELTLSDPEVKSSVIQVISRIHRK